MVAKNFKTDDLVWAKMKGYPPWPGKITEPPKDVKAKKAHHYVLFYSSNNYAWIHDDAIELHSEALVDKFTKGHKRPPSYLNAVQLIVAAGKNKSKTGKVLGKSGEESAPEPRKKNSSISSDKKKVVGKKVNDHENTSFEASKEKEKPTKGKDLGKSGTSKSPKKQSLQKEKRDMKNISQKRSSSNDLSFVLSPPSPAKKQKTQRSESASKKLKTTKPSDAGEKSPRKQSKEKGAEILQTSDGLDSGDEISRKIKDEIDEINASAMIQNDVSSKIKNEVSNKEPSDFGDNAFRNINSPDMADEGVAEAPDFETTAGSKESIIPRQKDADKVNQKRRKKEPSISDRIDVNSKKAERQKALSEKSRTSQRSLRIGLSKNQKYCGVSSTQKKNGAASFSFRGKGLESRDAKALKNLTASKKFSSEDSDSSTEKRSRGYSSLLTSERIDQVEHVEDCEMSSPVLFTKPESTSIDVKAESETLKLKNVTPTKKKIGFLGLGSMGQRIVKNLILSGHSVTVWNRTASKCDNFAGVEKAPTPADLVMACDIIFCCLADDDASKTVFFGLFGVANGLRSAAMTGEKKGFVEMTTIDPETSKAINLEVNLKGGRYLEAQLSGSQEQASEGNLLIVAAGDKSLFDDCHSCFIAMGKTAMLVSDQVGVASTYNTIHSMLYGSVYAALAEALALVESIGLKKEVFIDSFMDPNVKSVVNLDKNHLMGQASCPVNIPLMHVQKSLNAGLKFGSTFAQPMHVSAAANEVYKLCRLLKFDNRDISAVYEAATR